MEDNDGVIKKRWITLLILSFLILFGTFHWVFALIAFGIMSLLIFIDEEEFGWIILFFSIPFANIFKLSSEGTSLYTFLIFIFVIRLFMKKKEISALLIFFAIYMLMIPCLTFEFSNFHVLRWIKLISNIMLLYYFFAKDESHDETSIFLAYVFGIIVSSLFRFVDSDIFRISNYTKMVGVGGSGLNEAYYDLNRFSGLYNDPNYYSINLIIALCLMVILFYKRKISISVLLPVSFIFSFFVIRTYSKSAILMMILPVGLFLYSNKKKSENMGIICIGNSDFYYGAFCAWKGK